MNPQYIHPQGVNIPSPMATLEQINPQMSNMTLGSRPPSYGPPAPSKSPLPMQGYTMDNSMQYINGSITQGKPPGPQMPPGIPTTAGNQMSPGPQLINQLQSGPPLINKSSTTIHPTQIPSGFPPMNQSNQPPPNQIPPGPGFPPSNQINHPGSVPTSTQIATGFPPSNQLNPLTSAPIQTQVFPLSNQSNQPLSGPPPKQVPPGNFSTTQQLNQPPTVPTPTQIPPGSNPPSSTPSQIAPSFLPSNQSAPSPTQIPPGFPNANPPSQLTGSTNSSPMHSVPHPTQAQFGNLPPGSNPPISTNQLLSGSSTTILTSQSNILNARQPQAPTPPTSTSQNLMASSSPLAPPSGHGIPPRPITSSNTNFPPNQINQNGPHQGQFPPSLNMTASKPAQPYNQMSPMPPTNQGMNPMSIPQGPPIPGMTGMPPPPLGNNTYGQPSQIPLQSRPSEGTFPPQGFPPMNQNGPPQGQFPSHPNMPPSKPPQPYNHIPPLPHQGMSQMPPQPQGPTPGMPPPPPGASYPQGMHQMPPQSRHSDGTYPPPHGFPPMGANQGQFGQTGYQGPPHMPMHSHMGQMPHNQGPRPMDPAGAAGARRLDPDQMPSPIQVMADDQRNRGGVFATNQRGLVPPLVTTNFTVQDGGHCSPRFIRATAYTIPATPDMVKQTSVPLGLVISPLAEPSLHLSDFGSLGPVRCIRCKAYMSPMMQFLDGGRRFHCPLCKATTDTPAEYFAHLDHTGQRVDRGQRPELSLGAYELAATIDYCRDNILPQPPALIFILDVSYNSVRSGLLQLMCAQLKSVLEFVPQSMRVGFVTYSSQVHFYNVSPVLAQPQRLTVPDIGDVFVPILEGFLVQPTESAALIDQLLNELPTMFAETRETEVALWPAVKAGLEGLRAAQRCGRLLVFNTTLPIAEAPGKLRSREDRKLLGTDKERTVLLPQNQSYNQLAQECVENGVGVDLFVMNNAYADLATIGQLSRLTGGQIYKYTYFQADIDGDRLLSDLKHNVSRPQAFDAIMRVRTSTGIRATDFYGHMYMSNTTDMELATIDQDKGIAVELKHDDKLSEEEPVLIQVALLYTNIEGQRRLRVMNLGLRSSTQMADLYRACDLDAVLNLFSKQLILRLMETAPKQAKDTLVNRCASMLACYRKHCASPSSAGQLILPECMKLLPLYLNCLLRCDAVSGGPEIALDDRSFAIYSVAIMDVPTSVVHLYPRLVPVTDLGEDTRENTEDIEPLRCSYDKLKEDGAYLLDNGLHMFLWMGLGLSSDWARDVFGVANIALVDTDQSRLPDIDTPRSVALREYIEGTRIKRKRCMRLTLVRQRDKMENVFKHFLVEDRGFDGSASYVDFLCHMHKEIRTLLT